MPTTTPNTSSRGSRTRTRTRTSRTRRTRTSRSRSRSRAQAAWQHTSQSTRQVQLWWKHSSFFASGMSSRDFSGYHDETPDTPSTLRPTLRPSRTPRRTPTTIAALPNSVAAAAAAAAAAAVAVPSVDHALQALSGYRDQFPEQKYFEPEVDWILDGHPHPHPRPQNDETDDDETGDDETDYDETDYDAWYEQQDQLRQTQDLLAQLHASSRLLDDPNWQWEYIQTAIGQQELQFASFDGVGIGVGVGVVPTKKTSAPTSAPIEREMDGAGGFSPAVDEMDILGTTISSEENATADTTVVGTVVIDLKLDDELDNELDDELDDELDNELDDELDDEFGDFQEAVEEDGTAQRWSSTTAKKYIIVSAASMAPKHMGMDRTPDRTGEGEGTGRTASSSMHTPSRQHMDRTPLPITMEVQGIITTTTTTTTVSASVSTSASASQFVNPQDSSQSTPSRADDISQPIPLSDGGARGGDMEDVSKPIPLSDGRSGGMDRTPLPPTDSSGSSNSSGGNEPEELAKTCQGAPNMPGTGGSDRTPRPLAVVEGAHADADVVPRVASSGHLTTTIALEKQKSSHIPVVEIFPSRRQYSIRSSPSFEKTPSTNSHPQSPKMLSQASSSPLAHFQQRPMPLELHETPQPSIYTTPQSKTKTEPRTPTTNNYSQPGTGHSRRKLFDRAATSSPTFVFGDAVDMTVEDEDDDSESDTHHRHYQHQQHQQHQQQQDGGVSLTTEPSSVHSSGIPSVVQLFTQQLPDSAVSFVIPSTVRLPITKTSNSHSHSQSGEKEKHDRGERNSTSIIRRPSNGYFATVGTPLPRLLRLSFQSDRETSTVSHCSIASPEGRFLRRQSQLMLDDDDDDDASQEDASFSSRGGSSLGSLKSILPDLYWKHPEQDGTVELLSDLEWDWIPYWQLDYLWQEDGCDESYVQLWLEQITEQLSDWDAAHVKTCRRLYQLIQPHALELQDANEAALDLAKNIQLCQMYLERSQTSIQLAKYGKTNIVEDGEAKVDGGGVLRAQQLLRFWDTHYSYSTLDGIVQEMSTLLGMEQELVDRIDAYDVRQEASIEECKTILSRIEELQDRLKSTEMSRLTCLEDLRERASGIRSQAFATRLHIWLESMAVRSCRPTTSSGGFDPQVFHRLVHAMLLTADESTKIPDGSFTKSFCTSVHTALLLETQKSFGLALLNPSDSEYEESKYDQELMALSTNAYLNPSRMGVWTHNLVTIRFDFELEKNLLAAIYHKLCWLLTNVLHGQYCVLQWHAEHRRESNEAPDAAGDGFSSLMAAIYEEMQSRRSSIWNACVKVLEECLGEKLKFVSKKKLFRRHEDGSHDYSVWREDLNGLADVLRLTDQFLSLREEFLVGISKAFINDGSMLRETLYEIQKKHLRSFHVEAMNTIGLSLYRETWNLVPLVSGGSQGGDLEKTVHQTISHTLMMDHDDAASAPCRSQLNRFTSYEVAPDHLRHFQERGNPFETYIYKATVDDGKAAGASGEMPSIDASILNLLNSFVGQSPFSCPLVPACFSTGIFPWMARLLVILENLPPIVADVCKVFADISDLYTTTVFRICCGSTKNERVLLGMDGSVGSVASEQTYSRAQGAASPRFGFGRKSPTQPPKKHSAAKLALLNSADAEILSPLPFELEETLAVQDLILAAQKSLRSVAKLDLVDRWVPDPDPTGCHNLSDHVCKAGRVLEKRQAGLWGCVILSVTLEIARTIADDSFDRNSGHKYGLTLDALERYVFKMIRSTPKIIELGNRISCVRAIRGKWLLEQILSVGGGWEESKLHEHPNEYVDSLCDFCALLWCSLHNAKHLPIGGVELIWSTIVQAGFETLLDGFSRVPFCSTEGRALMSMDLASYSSGMSGRSIEERLEGHAQAPRPPNRSIARGMSYVDTFIKVFYFPPMDALDWIKENFQSYRKNHLVALIAGAATSSNDRTVCIKKLIDQVERLYPVGKEMGVQTRAKIA